MRNTHPIGHYIRFVDFISVGSGVCLSDMVDSGISYPTLISFRKKFEKAGLIYSVKEHEGFYARRNIFLTPEGEVFVKKFKDLKPDILKSLMIENGSND